MRIARLTLPGVVTAWLGFRAGGFFPGQVGLVGSVLCLLLVLRITVAQKPFAGLSPALALGFGALAGFAVWILASAAWSHAPARALSEFDRALLYALVLLLTGSAATRVGDLAMLLRFTAAAFTAMALAGLLTRLAPGTFPISAGFLPERIAFPITYWNAMGIACAMAILLAVHLSASGREPRILRVVAAAALPPLAVTLYLTFSRGAIWALPVGLVLYVLLGQARGLLTAGIAALPARARGQGRLRRRPARAGRLQHRRGRAAGPSRRVDGDRLRGRRGGVARRRCCSPIARIERIRLPARARTGFVAGVIVVGRDRRAGGERAPEAQPRPRDVLARAATSRPPTCASG